MDENHAPFRAALIRENEKKSLGRRQDYRGHGGELAPGVRDPFSESFQHIHVVGSVNCLSLRYKLLMGNSLAVEKINEDCFSLDVFILAFFGLGDCLLCHSELCRFVSRPYWKAYVSSL